MIKRSPQRGKRLVRGVICALVAAVCCVQLRVYADDPDAELRKQIQAMQAKSKPEPRRRPAEKVRTAKDEMRSMRQGLNFGTPAPAQSSRVEEILGIKAGVVEHYRLNSGVGFPAPEEAIVPPVPTFAINPALIETPVWRVEPAPLTRPPRCEKNFTQRRVWYPDLDDTKILYQSLYVSEDLVPIDTSEVYGPDLTIVAYGEPASKGVNLRMKLDQVPCVPFRRRWTAQAMYEDYGNNALKNFADNPAGNGVYHSWIEQKIFGSR